MADRVHPFRSVLFMPATNRRAMAKARALDCDAVIFDLEDSILPDAKADARAAAAEAVMAGGYGHRTLLVRVNLLDSPWGEADFEAISKAAPDGVLLPKVRRADDLRDAEALLDAFGAPPATRLWAMMETPRAILDADAIGGATARLAGLVAGTNDLAKELRAASAPGRQPFYTALGLCVLAARAHGLVAIDGVFVDLEDTEGFAAECRQGAAMGFDGKTLIHPKQIEAANAAFRPDEKALDHARRVVEAWRTAAQEGRGVAVVDGHMIEELHAKEAERLLALHEAIEAHD